MREMGREKTYCLATMGDNIELHSHPPKGTGRSDLLLVCANAMLNCKQKGVRGFFMGDDDEETHDVEGWHDKGDWKNDGKQMPALAPYRPDAKRADHYKGMLVGRAR